MTFLLALILCAPAQAGGFWHPMDVGAESEAFGRLTEGTMGPFEERSQVAAQTAQALVNYQLAIDLLGSRAPEGEQARLDALEKQFNRDKAVLEAFAGALIEDVDTTFRAAVDRALSEVEGEVVECEREIVSGPQVPGMRPRTEKNPDCTGDDLNARIAKALDQDAELSAAIDEILALQWPDFDIATETRPAAGPEGKWVAVRPLFVQGAPKALAQIDRDDENARLPFQSAIENNAEPAELKRLAKEAEAITEQTAARRAALAEPVLAASEKTLGKWGESVGWCANPVSLGGCSGDNATKDLVGKLLAEPRVEKSLRKASEAVGG